ncbi:MAG TPA: hypothetical protein VGP12_03965, partial [Nitrosospira sp.]|nr:hypothetical protein [Nitrosospira sp.]
MTKIFGKHFYFDRSSRRDGGAAPGAGVLPGPVNANTPIRHPQDSGPRPFTLNLGIAEFAFSSGKLAKANPAATPETPVTSFPKTEVTETHVLSIDVDAIGDNNKKYGEASTSASAPKVITVPSIKTNVLHTDQKPLSKKKIQDFLRQHSHPPIAKTNVLHTDQKPLSKKKIQDFLRQHSNPSIAKTVTPIAPIKWKTVTMRPSPLKPLIAAVNANNEEQIKALATALHEKNNYTAKDIAPILTRAIQNGASLEVKKALADLAKLDPTHLFDAAAKADDVELVRHLAQKATPPAEALGSGSPKMQRLLKVISDAHALYPSPTDPMTVQKLIHAAAKADDLELIRELVREGKPPAGALRCGGRKMQQFLAEIDDAYTPFSSPTHQLTKQKLERNIKRFDTNEAAYERYLNENTVAHMTERLRQVAAAAKKPEARINLMNELGSALVKAPAAIQSQVVGNLIQALGVAGAGDQKNTHDCLKITLAQLDNVLAPVGEEPDAAAFHRILQGMLEGMANTPDLPEPLRDTLMGCVDNWCVDVKKVKDEGYTALLDGIKQAVEAIPEEERKPYEHIGYTAYARRVASTLDQIEDKKLPEVVRILRRCAKHCLGKDLHDTFTETINRIDVRNPSIGKIPEFAHAVWLGKQISQNDVKNILDFLRENESHQVHIATEKPSLTMRALLDYCEMSHGSGGQLTWLAKGKELLQRVKV